MNILSYSNPSPNILQQLANGSLDQDHNLTRAIRLWLLLHWLYNDQGKAAMGNIFTIYRFCDSESGNFLVLATGIDQKKSLNTI